MQNNDNGIILIIREALNLERHHLIKRKNHFMLFTDLCFFFLFFSFFYLSQHSQKTAPDSVL